MHWSTTITRDRKEHAAAIVFELTKKAAQPEHVQTIALLPLDFFMEVIV